ncbi:MAG: hypothetical protein JXA21_01860 [Anaerolineae bacterium]|nr:hypothetical protein [Anaerolineae bacterium]
MEEQTIDVAARSRKWLGMRVDLQRNGDSWDVVWVGERWRCKAGRGGWGWSKALCS